MATHAFFFGVLSVACSSEAHNIKDCNDAPDGCGFIGLSFKSCPDQMKCIAPSGCPFNGICVPRDCDPSQENCGD